MEAASLCPKCGIELQAELGSRCPLCGTTLQAVPDRSYAPTDPAIAAPDATPVSPLGAAPADDADSAPTTTGWSIEASPPTPAALRPAPTSPFTPMPSLVPAPATLPPPPFAAGAASLRPAAAPLPGPPVLGGRARAPFSDPDSADTAVMAGPPLPAARPLLVEPETESDEDAVDASLLEVTQTAPGLAAPAAGSEDVPTLSPTRVPVRSVSETLPPSAVAAESTMRAARPPIAAPPSSPAPKAISRPSPSAIARVSDAPTPVERPRRLRGLLFFVLGAAALGCAFYAGRLTAKEPGAFPVPPVATPAATPDEAPAEPESTAAAAP